MAAAAPTPEPLRRRLPALLAALEDGLVERRTPVRLALLGALAGEHTLLIGPPGTAKSQLARRLHLAFEEARYFERLLTRFTVPEELFGPLSIKALEEDRYERQTAGFLPQASIAFIDEVFKANSAILNAMLTLLNEREFDNGPRRETCPLISVIGATNAVPEDEVGEAFFDRFLLRVPVTPVSAEGFPALLAVGGQAAPPPARPLGAADREALRQAASQVALDGEVGALLGELRAHLARGQAAPSDRRWVKVVGLLQVAAASEGRAAVALWDLWLLPWCLAPDAARQASLRAWLRARLGVGTDLSPPRLTRVVEAFEGQAEAEHAADDLDYDEQGRLRFNADLAGQVSDAKGGSGALRMSSTRRRRYGEAHLGARIREAEALTARCDAYLAELEGRGAALAAHRAQAIWLEEDFGRDAEAAIAEALAAVRALRERAVRVRGAFAALPRLPGAAGPAPPPVDVEPPA
jgi:MoxR-like ATPase